jgi:exopolysaccharide biosynthesis polyprenyl glycosylphosphotransferase
MTAVELELDYLGTGDPVGSVVDERTLRLVNGRRSATGIRRRGWLVRRMLLAADLTGLIAAFAVAQMWENVRGTDHFTLGQEYLLLLLTLPVWVVVAKLYGLYERDEERTDHSTVDDLMGVLQLVTVGSWIVVLGTRATGRFDPTVSRILVFWVAAVLLISTGRSFARAYCRRQLSYLQNTIIVGAGDVGQLVGRKLLNHPEYGINLVGFVDDNPKERHDELARVALLGRPSELPEVVELLDVERVILAFSSDSDAETLALLRSMKDLDVQIDIVPRLFELVGTNVGLHSVEGIPLVGLPPLRLSRSSRLIKRGLDVAGASLGLLVLAPLLLVIGLLIRLETPGSALFRQERVGSGARKFRIFKFRTMVADADARKEEVAHLNMHEADDPRMFKIPDDPRVTRVGRILRRYSLDELPQLFNVINGDMSLVGPRPLIAQEDQYVLEWARKRLDLKPGMTGLWQVLGASDIPFDEMTKLDCLYVTNWTPWGDMKLVLKTIPSLIRKRRAY